MCSSARPRPRRHRSRDGVLLLSQLGLVQLPVSRHKVFKLNDLYRMMDSQCPSRGTRTGLAVGGFTDEVCGYHLLAIRLPAPGDQHRLSTHMTDQRKPRRQVVAHMTDLLKKLSETPEGMQLNYGVNRRHIIKFQKDSWGSASREELQILMSLADQRGMDFLTLETDEVWRTFDDSLAVSYCSRKRGRLRGEDLRAMDCLVKEGIHLEPPDTGDVIARMATRNCVLFGSPKNNPECEDALRELFAKHG